MGLDRAWLIERLTELASQEQTDRVRYEAEMAILLYLNDVEIQALYCHIVKAA